MDFVSPWMDKIRTTCQRAEIDHVDVIIDQCAVNFSVLPALTTFSNPMMWQSLYQGLPEDIYPEDAPVLVRVDLSACTAVLPVSAASRSAASGEPE